MLNPCFGRPAPSTPEGKKMGESQVATRSSILTLVGAAVLLPVPSAQAQETFAAPTPLDVKLADENGVDVLSGVAHFNIPDVGIGDLAHIKTVSSYNSSTQPQPYADMSPANYDNFVGGLGYNDARDYSHFNPAAWYPRPYYQVRAAGVSSTFYISQDHSLQSFDGSSLTGTGVQTWAPTSSAGRDHPVVLDSSQGLWTFTSRDGIQVEIDTAKRPTIGQFSRYLGVATKIRYPTGLIARINYKASCPGNARVQSVTRNDGLMLKYTYSDSSCGAYPTGVIAINTAYEYCDPMADTCSVDPQWRRSQYAYDWVNNRSIYNVTDQRGVVSRFTMDKWGRVLSYKPPGSTADQFTFQYCMSYFTSVVSGVGNNPPTLSQSEPGKADTNEVFCGEMIAPATYYMPAWWSGTYNRIVTVTRAGGQSWGYSLPRKLAPNDSPYPRQYTISRPAGPPTYVNIDTQPGGGLTGYINPAQAIVSYSNAESQRITTGQIRGGPAMTFSYDARGNILSNGIASAGYDAACANIVKCNKPNWVKDAAGNQADFTYDTTHGGVLTETLPADASGLRAQKRYTYVQRHAWFLNASGVMTRSTEPIWVLASMSFCKTSTAAVGGGCTAAGDEVVTTYDYGPDSGPNNLWLRGTVVTANGQSLRTCYGYNKFGDKISETSPRAGLAVCP